MSELREFASLAVANVGRRGSNRAILNGESMHELQSMDADERRTLARYRDAIGQVGDGFFVVDMQWRFIEVNEALCRCSVARRPTCSATVRSRS